MAKSLREIAAIKKAHQQELFRIPGVSGVSVGRRSVGGELTDEIVIIVHVDEKRPLDDLPPEEVIPRSIEGIATDVRAHPRFRKLAAAPPIENLYSGGAFNPLIGGITIGVNLPGGTTGAGTLGCFVSGAQGAGILTNEHVVGNSTDNNVYQPLPGSKPSPVATVTTSILSGSLGVDAAYCALTANQSYLAEIYEMSGTIAGTYGVTSLPTTVSKTGATTELTTGSINQLYWSTWSDDGIVMYDQLYIRSSNTNPFAQPGDSGSVTVNGSMQVNGLLWGGSADGITAAACPIQAVLDALSVSVITGTSSMNELPRPQRRSDIWAGAAAELEASARGRALLAQIRTLLPRARHIVHADLHLQGTWKLFHGGALLRELVQTIQARTRRYPDVVAGVNVLEAIARMEAVFEQYCPDAEVLEGVRAFIALARQSTERTWTDLLAAIADDPAAAAP